MSDDVGRPLRRFEYQQTREDFAALMRAGAGDPFSPAPLLAAAIAVGMGWGLAEETGLSHAWRILAMIPSAGVGFCFGNALRWFKQYRRRARWRPPAGPTRVEIFSDHIAIRENGRDRFEKWETLGNAVLGADHVFLICSGDESIILPLRAFRDRADMAAFCRFCEDKLRDEEDEGGAEMLDPPAEPITVTVKMLPQDNVEAPQSLAKGAQMSFSRAALLTTLIGGVISSGLAPLLAKIANLEMDFATWMAFGWPGAILLTWLGARRMEAALRQDWPADDPRRLERDYTIDLDGLTSRGTNFETRVDWNGIEEIRVTESYVLFVTCWKDLHGAPRRCFADQRAFEAFVAGARAFKSLKKEAFHVESPS